MANRRIDPRRIKIHRSCTVEEWAEILGTHKNTVRRWVSQGLPTVDGRRPTRASCRANERADRQAAQRGHALFDVRRFEGFLPMAGGKARLQSRISYADAEYFNLSEKEARVATARRGKDAPTIEQIRHILKSMPAQTDIEKRDRALIAFTLLTGARVGAIASFKLKHIDVAGEKIEQDAREVKTKRSKTFTTWFFPVGDDIREIVVDWVNLLRMEKLWGDGDPLFPATEVASGPDQRFAVTGLARKHWSGTASLRRIFKDAFAEAGVPYANPHSFRNTLMEVAYERRLSHEELKAWSQNFGHDGILTTFCSYGEVSPHRQAEIMRDLASPGPADSNKNEIAQRIVELASQLWT
jgi:integrase/recombinase XerD